MIERKPVDSSNIVSIGHCPDTNTLAVEFKNGGTVYHYLGVPKSVYEEALASKSVGGFLHKNVKGKYDHEKQE
jgi:KTSC domain